MYTVSIRQLIFRRCKTVAERLKIDWSVWDIEKLKNIGPGGAFAVMAD